LISPSLVLMLDELFWLRTKKISGHSRFYSVKAVNLSMLDFKILEDSLSRLPLVFIITKSDTAKQNRTNFESKSFLLVASFLLRVANRPSVSIKNTPSQLGSVMLENLK
jgi:hypothetical protein